jgi:hypothetical protein
MLPNCPKCGKMLESIDIKSPYIEVFDNYVDRKPFLLNTGVCAVIYRCHGEEWSEWLREGDALKLRPRVA